MTSINFCFWRTPLLFFSHVPWHCNSLDQMLWCYLLLSKKCWKMFCSARLQTGARECPTAARTGSAARQCCTGGALPVSRLQPSGPHLPLQVKPGFAPKGILTSPLKKSRDRLACQVETLKSSRDTGCTFLTYISIISLLLYYCIGRVKRGYPTGVRCIPNTVRTVYR